MPPWKRLPENSSVITCKNLDSCPHLALGKKGGKVKRGKAPKSKHISKQVRYRPAYLCNKKKKQEKRRA
jgi:hypothetical protein